MLQYCIKQIQTNINKYILHVLSIKLRYKLYYSYSIPTQGVPHFYYILGANLGLRLYGEVAVMVSLLEIRKHKSRSHGIKKKGKGKRKKRAVKRSNTSLKDLSKVLEDHGRHAMLSFLSSLPISVLRILDTEANKFYDRNHSTIGITNCTMLHS